MGSDTVFASRPGPLNAITDVAGVTVGHATIISGDGPLVVGKGPVRTGVTAVLPRGRDTLQKPSFGGWFSLNGNGEMTGTTWVEESGFLEGPVLITNTHSVDVVRDAAIAWRLARTGAMSGNGSGDVFIAFSTANPGAFAASGLAKVEMLSNEEISPLFDATALATEEAVINALVASDTMTGVSNRRVIGFPPDRLREVIRKYNRLVNPAS